MTKELFTIGYEGASQGAVFQALAYNDVNTLVDIRELPLSRKPGLSKKGLSIAAGDYGMRYIHLRALGTPRDIRYQRKIDHDQIAFREHYVAYLDTQTEAMEALTALIHERSCCLLCYEADPKICHRWFVAERAKKILGEGLEVVHLHPEPLSLAAANVG